MLAWVLRIRQLIEKKRRKKRRRKKKGLMSVQSDAKSVLRQVVEGQNEVGTAAKTVRQLSPLQPSIMPVSNSNPRWVALLCGSSDKHEYAYCPGYTVVAASQLCPSVCVVGEGEGTMERQNVQWQRSPGTQAGAEMY